MLQLLLVVDVVVGWLHMFETSVRGTLGLGKLRRRSLVESTRIAYRDSSVAHNYTVRTGTCSLRTGMQLWRVCTLEYVPCICDPVCWVS